MNRRNILYGGAAAVAAATGAGVAWWKIQPHQTSAVAPSTTALADPFWAMGFDTPDGQTLAMNSFLGKPLLVNFWGTWCPVCMQEIGTIDSLARDHDVLTVATNSGEADAIRAAMAKHGVSFPVVVDAEGELARAWGVRAFPTSFFVTSSRAIRLAETGYTTSVGFRARLWLTAR